MQSKSVVIIIFFMMHLQFTEVFADIRNISVKPVHSTADLEQIFGCQFPYVKLTHTGTNTESNLNYNRYPSIFFSNIKKKIPKRLQISVTGEVGTYFAKSSNKDYYKTSMGGDNAIDMYLMFYKGLPPITDMETGTSHAELYTRGINSLDNHGMGMFSKKYREELSRTQDVYFALARDASFYLAKTRALGEIKWIAEHPIVSQGGYNMIRVLGSSDAGTLGNYIDVDKLKAQYNSNITVGLKYYAQDGLSCGVNVNLVTNSSEQSRHSNTDIIRNEGVSMFFTDINGGMIKLGTGISAAEAMRIDASVLSTVDGGIDGDWFRYANIEGLYQNASYERYSLFNLNRIAEHLTKVNLRGVGVKHPFHVLPRLYTEYARVQNPPWLVQGKPIGLGNAPKISFYSSNQYGLKVGLSYTHNQGDNFNLNTLITQFDKNFIDRNFVNSDNDGYKNVFSGGISLEKYYGDIGLKIVATGELGKKVSFDLKNFDPDAVPPFAFDPNDIKNNFFDLNGWQIGFLFSNKKFKLAGSYANMSKSGLYRVNTIDLLQQYIPKPQVLNPGDTTFWTMGSSWNFGPLIFSVTYFESTTRPQIDDARHESQFRNFAFGLQYDQKPLSDKKSVLKPYISLVKFNLHEGGRGKYLLYNSGDVLMLGAKFIF